MKHHRSPPLPSLFPPVCAAFLLVLLCRLCCSLMLLFATHAVRSLVIFGRSCCLVALLFWSLFFLNRSYRSLLVLLARSCFPQAPRFYSLLRTPAYCPCHRPALHPHTSLLLLVAHTRTVSTPPHTHTPTRRTVAIWPFTRAVPTRF